MCGKLLLVPLSTRPRGVLGAVVLSGCSVPPSGSAFTLLPFGAFREGVHQFPSPLLAGGGVRKLNDRLEQALGFSRASQNLGGMPWAAR